MGCQITLGCGGLLAVALIAIIIGLITAFCGGTENDFGYDSETQVIRCQEYIDADLEESEGLLWGEDEVEVFSIQASLQTDRIDWDKNICPGIAETTGGKYEVWYFVVGVDGGEWLTLGYDMKPLESPPESVPSTKP